MNERDRQAITTLFDTLAAVGELSPPRDSEAEVYIRERLVRQPAAPYHMAQTIVIQREALKAAETRIKELQAAVLSVATGSNGGRDDGKAPGPVGGAGKATTEAGSTSVLGGGSAGRHGQGFLAGAATAATGAAGD